MFFNLGKIPFLKNASIALCVFLALCACVHCEEKGDENPSANLQDRVVIDTPRRNPVEVTVELAVTPEERSRGLMGREYLDPNHGMLFIFPEERQLSFWMKNTPIELDMIFIRSDMTVLGCVERAAPETTTSRFIKGNSQYVLEVAGGFCRKHGVGATTRVQFKLPGINMHK